MKIDRIEAILKSYKLSLGRCNHLKAEMAMLERQLEFIKIDTAETLAAPKPRVLSDMPRGTQISNPTEKYGGMLADGYKSGEQIALESKYAEMEAEYNDRITDVDRVKAWLSGLTDRERAVIVSNVIDDLSWKETVSAYNAKFSDAVSKDTLKRIKDKAMDKISEMAK